MGLLTSDEITQALAVMPGWERQGDAIVREFSLDGGFLGSVGSPRRRRRPITTPTLRSRGTG